MPILFTWAPTLVNCAPKDVALGAQSLQGKRCTVEAVSSSSWGFLRAAGEGDDKNSLVTVPLLLLAGASLWVGEQHHRGDADVLPLCSSSCPSPKLLPSPRRPLVLDSALCETIVTINDRLVSKAWYMTHSIPVVTMSKI